ncbi:MAG: hypothetical protein R3264_08015, partial [Anaerolineae bacterium]|nr:hypothetical protein [Anaerolineae bacterium]
MFYLIGSLFVAVLFVGLLLFRPDLKRQGLIPALIFSPYGPISELIYFRDYWLPEPVLPPMVLFGQSFLTEDLIFAFGIVGLMSVAYDVVRGKHPAEGIHPRRVWPAVGLSLVAMGLFIGLSLATRFNSIVVGSVVAVGCAVPMIIV